MYLYSILEQMLFKLKNENLIDGKRGPSGGYKLAQIQIWIYIFLVFRWRKIKL